jgi:hypothetical protein
MRSRNAGTTFPNGESSQESVSSSQQWSAYPRDGVFPSRNSTEVTIPAFNRTSNAFPAIFPAVAENQARLRFFMTSRHTKRIENAHHAVVEELPCARPPRPRAGDQPPGDDRRDPSYYRIVNRLISMSCAAGMFPNWEESPESQAGVDYPFPAAVGNCGKPGNSSSRRCNATAARRAPGQRGQATGRRGAGRRGDLDAFARQHFAHAKAER